MLEDFVFDETSNNISELLSEPIPRKWLDCFNLIILDISCWIVMQFIQELDELFKLLRSFSHYLLGGPCQYFRNYQNQLLLYQLSKVVDVFLGYLVHQFQCLFVNLDQQCVRCEFVQGIFGDKLWIIHWCMAFYQNVDRLDLTRSNVVIKFMIFLMILNVFF